MSRNISQGYHLYVSCSPIKPLGGSILECALYSTFIVLTNKKNLKKFSFFFLAVFLKTKNSL